MRSEKLQSISFLVSSPSFFSSLMFARGTVLTLLNLLSKENFEGLQVLNFSWYFKV